jgi:subtilisin family serine protease
MTGTLEITIMQNRSISRWLLAFAGAIVAPLSPAVLPVFIATVPTASSAAAQVVPHLFEAIPGEREFSGVLVARPLQATRAAERGLSEAEHARAKAQAERDLRAIGVARHFPEVDEFLVKVPEGETESTVIARLMATGNFEYVEPDWIVFPVACPNDGQFTQQWHHAANRLGSCAAWDLETGSPDIVVAICDTGILATHEDLLLHKRDGFHVPSQTWESQGGPINDINGHGTNCSGSAAANGNNSVGVAGMGWNLGHRTMRVTDSADGSASLSNLTLAARTAADAGDKVASVSYSGVNSSTVFTTGDYVRSKGALLVWAAGNSNVNLSGNREDSVIVVGATDQNDARASFSNYGTLVDLFAPGVSIRTTARTATNAYANVSGTSFACPITAGLCGLIWSRNPSLTPAQVESILRSTCVDLGTAGVDGTFGYGRINAAAAITATQPGGPDTTPPAAPTGLVGTAGTARVDLAWNASPEPDLAGYAVFRSTDGVNFSEITASLLTTTSFANTGLVNGVTYSYFVVAEDTAGNASAASSVVSRTPVAPPPQQTLFADGFESGNLTAGGWVIQSTNSFASTAAKFDGAWGARVRRTSWMERTISTAGFNSIELRVARRTAGLESNEWLYIEWWNGSAWSVAAQVRPTAFEQVALSLPPAAANLSNFKIRFRTNANRNDEWADLDVVEVRGTPSN